ncbi:MAG: Ig-like domain-containing protein, partial [Methanoregulaceae archaeon]|nr:Ig-like domain-containing protein [Methanoregulaceae archaeon]
MNMRKYSKYLIITWFTLAILILPSPSLAFCNCAGENPGRDTFSSVDEARTCYDYCKSPVAYDSNVMICENTLVEIPLNATDPDGDMITYRIEAGPFNGTLATVTGNRVVYIPKENFTGIDSFSYRVSDWNRNSNTATITITVLESDGSPQFSHLFYGNVTIDGNPAPENTTILAAGPGVRAYSTQNPVATLSDGSYGSAEIAGQKLLVKGCIENGTPLSFYVDGVPAEVCDTGTGGLWQSDFPFSAGGMTRLDIRVISPGPSPKEVYIDGISMSITNSTYGFSSTI